MRGVVLVLAPLVACAEGPLIALGPLDQRAASVLISLSQGDQLHVKAASAAVPIELELPEAFDEARPIRVTRIAFEHSLEVLGLPEGEIESAPAPNHAVASFPRLSVESGLLESDAVAELIPGQSDERLEALRVAYPPCPRFRFEPVAGLEASGISTGVSIRTDGTAVFDTLLGVVVARPDQTQSFIPRPGTYGARSAISPSGAVWYASQLSLARLDVETLSFPVEIPVPSGLYPVGLVIASDEPLVAYVIDLTARVFVYRDLAWTIDHVIPPAHYLEPFERRTQTVHLGGDEFIFGAERLGPILRHRNGEYTAELLELGGRGFPAFAFTRDGDLFTVEYEGAVFFRELEAWRPGPSLTRNSFGFALFGIFDLLLYGTDDGAVGLFSPEAGVVCDPEPVGELVSAVDFVRFKDRYFLAGAIRESGPEMAHFSRFGWLEVD